MTMGPRIGAGQRMCAVLTRDRGEDPVGHASTYDRIIIAEIPKPWPRSATNAPGVSQALPDLVDHFQTLRMRSYRDNGEAGVKAQGLNVALIYVAPDPEYSSPGHKRVFHLSRPKEPFSAYCKEEFQVLEAGVTGLMEALLYQKPTHQWQKALERSAGRVRELLVCTQGSVDTCCGTFGYPLYSQLRRLANSAAGELRVWQATHFQYHRFAPVVLDLPGARVWGAVSPDRAETLALRNMPRYMLLNCYIGWAGVEQGYMQAAEREALIREGWYWTTYRKSGRLIQLDGGEERAQVQLDFASSDEEIAGSYLATVEVVEHIPGLVGCLSPDQSLDAPQYRVSGVKRRVWARKPTNGRQGIERAKDVIIPQGHANSRTVTTY